MTHDENTQAVAEKITNEARSLYHTKAAMKCVLELLAAYRDSVRRSVLEEAAGICDEYGSEQRMFGLGFGRHRALGAEECKKRIRSRMQSPSTTEEHTS